MLTSAQNKVWEFIQTYMLKHKEAPTIAEITEGMGLKSRSAMHRAVRAIADEGLIEIIPNKRRNILINRQSMNDEGIPLVGTIAAGQPIEAIENQEYVDLNALFVGPDRYLLKVKGDSMIGDNICNGDYVICQRADAANDGKIVVALIDNQEATLKRMYQNKDGTVKLVPSNPELSIMIYPTDRVRVQGIFLGLFRLGDTKFHL